MQGYAYSNAFSLDIKISTSTRTTKNFVLLVLVLLLVLCAFSLQSLQSACGSDACALSGPQCRLCELTLMLVSH